MKRKIEYRCSIIKSSQKIVKLLDKAEFAPIIPQHSALSTQHSALSTQHSALSTQHSALSTQHSALSTQHSALSTQHSALSTQHSALSTLLNKPQRSPRSQRIIKEFTTSPSNFFASFAPLAVKLKNTQNRQTPPRIINAHLKPSLLNIFAPLAVKLHNYKEVSYETHKQKPKML
ncbi:hypothetical protein [Treponema sp. OMZ 798]|uniref:hypothetical protein n=1 Tax=Treponema sp. OMZ 798 TaxID=2563671 RepID=UPI0020A2B2AA|nr:hypothetical protein [Treponema sp. OMZ 798]UTC79148.1 hypothetical protein E4O07_00345 [Treponema sp. OMZ 798]